ncbi:hypothetical protein [Cryptosporangium japonicum]|uniref:Uncharacterized protein n=1 Tax=Cryptosporangium japonicum TaxID=80872 RepID=A0ABN0V451_9ACTN
MSARWGDGGSARRATFAVSAAIGARDAIVAAIILDRSGNCRQGRPRARGTGRMGVPRPTVGRWQPPDTDVMTE